MQDVILQFTTLQPLTVTFASYLFISVVLGYFIGAERELRGKDAGISTNMFVISGAMLFTLFSTTVDPSSESRIAAQIVSGIGFLGAGLILKEGTGVRNLTTAASIWYAGALGMAIGFGYLQIAVIAGIVGIFIPRIHHIQPQMEYVASVEKEMVKHFPSHEPEKKKRKKS